MDFIKGLAARKVGSKVEFVDLYLKDQATDLSFVPESESWQSKLSKFGEAKLVFKVENEVFCVDALDGNFKGTSVLTEELGADPAYEKALRIAGPFPTLFLINYFNLAFYKTFGPNFVADPRAAEDAQNAYTSRDFAIGLIGYLEYVGKNIGSEHDEVFGYKVELGFRIEVLNCEAETRQIAGPSKLVRIY